MKKNCEELDLALVIPPEYVAFCTETYVNNPQHNIYYIEREKWERADEENFIRPSLLNVDYKLRTITLPIKRSYIDFVDGLKKKELVEIISIRNI